jgi:hypothetical protein
MELRHGDLPSQPMHQRTSSSSSSASATSQWSTKENSFFAMSPVQQKEAAQARTIIADQTATIQQLTLQRNVAQRALKTLGDRLLSAAAKLQVERHATQRHVRRMAKRMDTQRVSWRI